MEIPSQCTDRPEVSVIVPNYNHAQYLEQRLCTILNQTFQDIEVIILDDASTDDSRVLIEKYRNHPGISHIIYNDTNSGSPFSQWAKGISYARGEWVWIAESDDWADSDFLDYMLKQAVDHPDCGLVYSLPAGMGPDSHNHAVEVCSGMDFIRKKQYFGNAVRNASAVIMKRSVLVSIDFSLFREHKLCGDWFCYILMAEETNVLFCPERHSHYRVHDGNTSSGGKRCGLSFIEGAEVLRYIDTRYKVNRLRASMVWGNHLAFMRKRYGWDKDVNCRIEKCLKSRYTLVLLFSRIFGLRRYEA